MTSLQQLPSLRLGKTQLRHQQVETWQRKWDAACELLAREPIVVTDVDGTDARVTPDRLVSTYRHSFWIDKAYVGWSMEALRQACTDAGVLRLLESQGWSRTRTRNRRKQSEPKRRRTAVLSDSSGSEGDAAVQPDGRAQAVSEDEPLTAEEELVFAPVRSAFRKQQEDLQAMMAQMTGKDEEIARLRERLAEANSTNATPCQDASGACAMCAVLQTTVTSLQRNIELLEADNERLQGLSMLWAGAQGRGGIEDTGA